LACIAAGVAAEAQGVGFVAQQFAYLGAQRNALGEVGRANSATAHFGIVERDRPIIFTL
jgi:hypothetical protein